MERDEFLSKLGIGLLAVCAGCGLSACGSNPGDGIKPDPGNAPAKGSGNLFSINLDTELKNIGESKVSNRVILVRIAAGNVASAFTAVQVACTHEGSFINYNNTQGIFICPNHGSEFSKSGALLLGPAPTSLQQYTVIINGNTLDVVA